VSQGKKPPNPYLLTDSELLEYIELIEVFGSGAQTAHDASIAGMTAIQFARLAEGAVYANKAHFPNGRIGEFQLRAQRLMENCIAEECSNSGSRFMLESLREAGVVAANVFSEKLAELTTSQEAARRGAAAQCAAILREIEKFVLRHGKRGKPVGARASDLLSLWDSMALHDALALVAPGQGDKRDAIAEKVSTVVRTYIKFGHLPWRGETHQQCVDIHTRRIVRLLDSLPMTSRSYRGFSIIRRE